MSKLEISISVLTGICIIGIMILIGIDKDISVLVPITTTLVGWLIGKKQDAIVSMFKRK